MITANQIEDQFYPVERLSNGIVRGADELPKETHYTYFGAPMTDGAVPLTESLNLVDDEFAAFVLHHADPDGIRSLVKSALPPNRHGFSHILSVPSSYHSLLKGRGDLEAERATVILCLPIHKSEFSGTETADEFYEMRRRLVPTTSWTREAVPKISLRFDNPQAGRGTGDGFTLATLPAVIKLTSDLASDRRSFVEIVNFRSQVVEVLQKDERHVTMIIDRDDSSAVSINRDEIAERLTTFLLG